MTIELRGDGKNVNRVVWVDCPKCGSPMDGEKSWPYHWAHNCPANTADDGGGA